MSTWFLKSRYRGMTLCGAIFLTAMFLLRVALHIRSGWSVNSGLLETLEMYGLGLFHDAVTFVYIAALPVVGLSLCRERWLRSRYVRYLLGTAYFLAIFALAFDVIAEWMFWREFGVRYNFIAVDYLVYTHEVIGMIWESFPALLYLGVPLGVSVILFATTYRQFYRGLLTETPTHLRFGVVAGWAIALCLAFLFVDQSHNESSDNEYSNELAKNGLYSLIEAFGDNEIRYDRFYRQEDLNVAFSILRKELKCPEIATSTEGQIRNVSRRVESSAPEEKKNVVLIMVESLSAHFLGAFGNHEDITPNLDKLAEDSLFFQNLYATGTRTCRGLEAVTLSLPPTPGRSVVKRPDNAHLFNIGTIFRQRGYETTFFYSGYGYFDNMNAFFSGNGFRIVDRTSFADDEITFSNIWGACDQDLFNKTLKECDKSYAAGEPFFSFLMTTSNHRPYTYPQVIDIPSGDGRGGAVKYTDYAIGEFLDKARRKPWFANTVFVIVADHCASSAGKTKLPVRKYHIPLFIYAPGFIQPAKIDKLCSQIDIGPTIMALLHFQYESRFFGQDILSTEHPQRALIGNYQRLGLYARDRLTALLPRRETISYLVNDSGRIETEVDDDPEALVRTISYYQVAAYLLEAGLYSETP